MSYWYLASPYSNYPDGREAAYQLALENTAILMRAGVPVFSPIVHNHPIHLAAPGLGIALPDTHEFWVETVDRPMMQAAFGMILLRLYSWPKSRGVLAELAWFNSAMKPVIQMQPGVVPAELI